MSLRERTRPHTINQPAGRFTNLIITGTPEQIDAALRAAIDGGLLAFASAPTPLGDDPTRFRRYLRLRNQ
jgi:alkanesulfonate monooxygenase SsuD/methylene tetrahydromethanopterin reductase-like flavin-dependent oxidoreductase (luciferase family)